MTLDIHLHLHKQPNFEQTIVSYDQHGEYIDLYFSKLLCKVCNADLTYVERIEHCLEHEIIEVLTNLIRYQDGEPAPINHEGFDKLSLIWHKRTDTHICTDGTEWTLITG